jgi:hypothetical protein
VDPRLLLGVAARAGRSEVRAAHRRLRRALDPTRGGTPELVRLVDAAAAQLDGTSGDAITTDPRRVLGLDGTATTDEIHAAYRRLSLLVHPDRGGTDELFRVVHAAKEELLAPASRTRRTTRPPRSAHHPPWDASTAPGPPPPRGPYRAPPPDQRHVVPTWRALRDLAVDLGILLATALAVVVAFRIATLLGAAAILVAVVSLGSVLRPIVNGALRSVIVLLGTRVHVRDAVAPERFLEATCLDAPVGRLREGELYEAYVDWCADRAPVATWIFVERLRTLGLLLVKESAWEEGLWVGITLRRE